MAGLKTKNRRSNNGPATPAHKIASTESTDVLTLSEAARYLRISEEALLRMVELQALPGRNVSGQWRFFKPALQDWLRSPARPSKEALRSVIGSWKDDPDLDQMLKEIYQRRGRPMTEGEQ